MSLGENLVLPEIELRESERVHACLGQLPFLLFVSPFFLQATMAAAGATAMPAVATPSLVDLPGELFAYIAPYLNLWEVCQLRATCRSMARYSAELVGVCKPASCSLIRNGECVPAAVLAWAVAGSRRHELFPPDGEDGPRIAVVYTKGLKEVLCKVSQLPVVCSSPTRMVSRRRVPAINAFHGK